MAKILSHVWSSISGSVGGITYLNGPHASIIARARVNPVQPGTLFQGQCRAAWAAASAQWEALTEAVQEDWQNYAQTVTFQGKQGNYQVTGRLMYIAGRAIQLYSSMRGLYVPVVTQTAPETPGFLLPGDFQVGAPLAVGTGVRINFAADLVDDTAFFTQISGPFEKERHFWKGPWFTRDDAVTVVAAGAVGGIDYIGLTAAKIYFVRVKAVADDASPRISQEFFGRGVAIVTGP